MAEVLAWDQRRAWLLLADAGSPLGAVGNPPEAWLEVLPRYAELQRGEAGMGRRLDDAPADHLPPAARPEFDRAFQVVLGRARHDAAVAGGRK